MENWIILNKFVILVYCGFLFVENYARNAIATVFFILIYLSINMVIHILKERKHKIIFILLSVILITACYEYLNILFVFLIPINICEFMYFTNQKKWVSLVIIGASAFLINKNIMPEYLEISLLSCLVFYLVYENYNKINSLIHENDSLREKNDNLHIKLNKNKEYEKQMRYMSQLEERNKIAQEIHDNIGHTISGSLMQLEAAKILVENDKDKSKEIIQRVIDVLREGMEGIRVTLRSIKPPLEQIGINRVKLLIDESLKNGSIRSNLMFEGNLNRVSNVVWKILYENINEALTNVIKYSKATTVTISINILNKFVKLEVKDNGIGAYKVNKGLGIWGIEERTENIGGKVIIDGSNGFSIIMLLPLEGENHGN